jgi:hypothetical protein
MAETLGIVVSIIQLVDTALETRDYVEGFRNAPQEQKKLLAEMDDLRPLLGELLERITATPSSDKLQQMTSPLSTLKLTME